MNWHRDICNVDSVCCLPAEEVTGRTSASDGQCVCVRARQREKERVSDTREKSTAHSSICSVKNLVSLLLSFFCFVD